MDCHDGVVTDGRIEVRGDWDQPEARLYWRPLEAGTPAARGDEESGWQPSIYTVGSFEHDHARALRVMSALWQFLHGAPSRG